MTVKELSRFIGCEFMLTVEGFTIKVMVEDVKVSYGNTLAYVCPVGGLGFSWVGAHRLSNIVEG